MTSPVWHPRIRNVVKLSHCSIIVMMSRGDTASVEQFSASNSPATTIVPRQRSSILCTIDLDGCLLCSAVSQHLRLPSGSRGGVLWCGRLFASCLRIVFCCVTTPEVAFWLLRWGGFGVEDCRDTHKHVPPDNANWTLVVRIM